MDRYENWNRRRQRAMRDEEDWREEDERSPMRGERYRDYEERYGQPPRQSAPWPESRFAGRRFGGSDEGRSGDYYGGRPQRDDYGYERRRMDMPPDWSVDRWERGMEEERGREQRPSWRRMRGRPYEDAGPDRMGRWDQDAMEEDQWSPYDAQGRREMRGGRGMGMGMRGAGMPRRSFRGRGPKGYERSDQRIREDVCDILTEDDNIDASDMSVSVERGEVTLEGTVSSRHAKHMAENLADACLGVKEVHNRLRIKRSERDEQPSSGNGGQYYQGASKH